MTQSSTGLPTTANRRFPPGTEGHDAAQRGITVNADGDTADREELIASVVREWVIPVLVRKFLRERTASVDGAEVGQAQDSTR